MREWKEILIAPLKLPQDFPGSPILSLNFPPATLKLMSASGPNSVARVASRLSQSKNKICGEVQHNLPPRISNDAYQAPGLLQAFIGDPEFADGWDALADGK